jgi:hypothetical protein
VFTKAATGWRQTAELKGSDTAVMDNFGGSVAASGSTIVVGAELAEVAGRAYVFTRVGTRWRQTDELKGSDTAADDFFGASVALTGSVLVAGAYGHADWAGRAYVFGLGASVTTTTLPPTTTTTTTVPSSEHSLTVSLAFEGCNGLFTTNGSSCRPNDTVQLQVTDQSDRRLSIHTIEAGAAGVISDGNCVVNFSFGEVPIVAEYEFWWRQPAFGSKWTMSSPNGDESLTEVEGDGWNVSFELEPA